MNASVPKYYFERGKTLLAVLLTTIWLELPTKLGRGELLDLSEPERHRKRGYGLHGSLVFAGDEPNHIARFFWDLRVQFGHLWGLG